MSSVVRAKVLTNSSEDSYARVKLTLEGIWTETVLIESVGGIPLKKDDIVFVDITDVNNPLIIGRASSTLNKPSTSIDGSLLFESSDGTNWTVGFVKNNKIEIVNSNGQSVTIDGPSIELKGNITIKGGSLTTGGSVTPDGTGPYCGIPFCPFTGAAQTGSKVLNT